MPTAPVTPQRPASDLPASEPPATTARDPESSAPDLALGLAIIPSKIAPAVPARNVLTRQRLVDWLRSHADARLVLIAAEAGYGKSTLLTDHALHGGRICVWYRLESSDRDWITFLSYLVAAFQAIEPDFGRSTEALLRNVTAVGATRDFVLGQFLADLGAMRTSELDLVLDDYHFVEHSGDVRAILGRMLERGPEGLRVIVAGRGRPDLPIGRLLSQGRMAELTIDDLRFTRDEIDRLFETAYQQPLDREAGSIVADRTEGWAASLQLVSASIASSRPGEVASFIDALDGAKGPIYDFLAEEVLTRLSAATERVLVHASLVDRVRPELVSAALSVVDDTPSPSIVDAALDDAEALGLLTDRAATVGGRIHPLFRQFLGVHLTERHSGDTVMRMHFAIADAAEAFDWLTAAKHYSLAAEPAHTMRVLGSAAGVALGTGAWGAAVELADAVSDSPPPPAVEVMRARVTIGRGLPQEALERLESLPLQEMGPEEQGLVWLTRAYAFHMEGSGRQVAAEVARLAEASNIPQALKEIGLAWQAMLETNAGGCLTNTVDTLRSVARSQRERGLHYYAGVALHNAAYAQLARAEYRDAQRLGAEAVRELDLSDGGAQVVASTESLIATAAGERGDLKTALSGALRAAHAEDSPADAIADAAYLHVVCGDPLSAKALLARLEKGRALGSHELPSQAAAGSARFALHLFEGDLAGAQHELQLLESIEAPEMDWPSRVSVLHAIAALARGDTSAQEESRIAIETAQSQHAWRWMARARVLHALASGAKDELNLWLTEGSRESALVPLELADVIAMSAHLLDPLPEPVQRSIAASPARWLVPLRRQVRSGSVVTARGAAQLLVAFGSIDDAHLLREFDTATDGGRRRRGLASRLVRRVSPTVRVHDLGPTSYEVGRRVVTVTETRRRAASILLYLVSRPDLAATREQVMESLWPDQSPKSATNSLHQTLFFLRRDLEPDYEDGATADYIRMESDMVFLDPELFQVDSVAFSRQATDIIATGTARTRGPEMLRLYRGSFAPEFEYEEWAADWRTYLHATFLHLARTTADAFVAAGEYGSAADVLVPIVTVDPLALDLRGTLVACLAALGSADAAQAHYRSLADAHERDLGVPAPPYSDLVATIANIGQR